MLDKKDLQELISATRQHINLREAVIEKDYYVTQVIHALSNLENEYFKLIFCGGTCLAKAHKIVKRMSEDIDFKIQIKKTEVMFSKSRLLKELKEFRSKIKLKLAHLALIIDEPVVRNEGKYSRIELHYTSIFPTNAGLRPHILLEFTLADIHLPAIDLPVRTLIEEILKNTILFEPSSPTCISIDETAIEKWVGLTRRIIGIERKYHHDDKTLIRHVYDLNAIKHAGRINNDFFALAKAVITNDAKQFKNQHPEYSVDPGKEIRQSLALLKDKHLWKERYQEFVGTMIYEPDTALDYGNSIATIELLSKNIVENL